MGREGRKGRGGEGKGGEGRRQEWRREDGRGREVPGGWAPHRSLLDQLLSQARGRERTCDVGQRGAEKQSRCWRATGWSPEQQVPAPILPLPIPFSFPGDDGVTGGEATFPQFNLGRLRLCWSVG